MSLSDDIHGAATGDLEQRLSTSQRDNSRLRDQLGRAQEDINHLQQLLDLVQKIEDINPNPPVWTVEPSTGKHRGTPLLFITDTHFDEVVRPQEIMHLNAYNRVIAEQRLQRAFEGSVKVCRDLLGNAYKYDGAVVVFGGDIVSGDIHDELVRTNEVPTPATVEYFIDPMLAGLKLMREEFGKLHVVGVVGNHDRMGKKVPAKLRAIDSWTWLFYKILAREFRRHSTVTFDIPESPEAMLGVYDTRFLIHHGNDDRGGGGISGAFAPVFRGDHKRRRRNMSAARATGNRDLEYDWQLIGHWHHRISAPGFIVGGCLKGYDEFARSIAVDYVPPSQELLVVTPERGVTFQIPVWVQDREAEGW